MGKTIAVNKKARHDYELLDKYEAGIALRGSEVKAIRLGRVNLKDSFVKIIRGEAFLMNTHISYLDTTNPHFKPDERRPRKLLMHRKEIDKLFGKMSQEGLTLVPTLLYFNDRNKAKIQVALARGKNVADKRDTIKRRMLDREAQSAMKRYAK